MDTEVGFQLGDRIYINGGRYDKSSGRIYYLDENLIRILPDGVSNSLIDLPIVDDDIDESLGIKTLFVLEKRRSDAFVVQRDYAVGQIAETFTANGEPVSDNLTIEAVSEIDDAIVLVNSLGETERINFNFTGIPTDLPYAVLRSRTREEPVLQETETETEVETTADDDFELFDAPPILGDIKEIAITDRTYPDIVQRNDMMQEFVKMLDLNLQKNPLRLREIRKLVELCLLLRNSVVEYDAVGETIGTKETSYKTVLDIASGSNVSFSKPVCSAKRVVYLDKSNDNPTDTTMSVDIRYLANEIERENDIAKNFVGNASVNPGDFLPNWYISLDNYNKRNHVSWTSKEKEYKFSRDSEFFRNPIPDIQTPSVDGLPKTSNSGKSKKEPLLTSDFLGSVSYSYLRGLSGRYGRLRPKEEARLIESPEESSVTSFLLFPKKYERTLGSTRSGRLAYDVGRSLKPLSTVQRILELSEGISDIPSAGGVLAVGVLGNTLGNISIKDWLSHMPLSLHGLGDATVELSSYGFLNKEFSYEQQEVLIKKIESTIAHIKSTLRAAREKATADISALQFSTSNLISQSSVERLLSILKSEPDILELSKKIQSYIPFYKNSDIATVAALDKYIHDYMIATLSGNPGSIALYGNQYKNRMYIDSLYVGLAQKIKEEYSLIEPSINTCPHVSSYNAVQKIKEDATRMKLLAKYLTQFQDSKKDNFINCILCGKHCCCEHEYLLLQEYLYPREKETLHKEVILTFSGGVFQGKYICSNCGQPISSLEFDNSIEYDDNGKPMAGRSALVDSDALERDAVDEALGVPIGSVEMLQFDTPVKTLIYHTAKQIFDCVGIFPNSTGYLRIVQGVDGELVGKPREFALLQKSAKESKVALPFIDFDHFLNMFLVAFTTAYCILETQSNIPNYTPRFQTSGCSADFRGYPLGREDDKRIIQYFSCIVASIEKASPPWNLTDLYKYKDLKKRQKIVESYVDRVFKQLLIKSEVQGLLTKKRTYLLETYGKDTNEGGLQESIPSNFTPQQNTTPSEVIIAEAADESSKIQAFILESHKYAKDTLKSEINSPYMLRTCCVQPLQKPLGFWKDTFNLGVKNTPVGPRGSHSGFLFTLRKHPLFQLSISKDDYSNLFLKICNSGPRVGLPHEAGFNNICSYCGFKLPDFTLPEELVPHGKLRDSEIEKLKKDTDTYIKNITADSLKTQGLTVSETTFQQLLTAVHNANTVPTLQPLHIDIGSETLNLLYDLDPSPFNEWKELIEKTRTGLSNLSKSASDTDFALAYGAISDYSVSVLEQFKNYLQPNDISTINNLLDQPVCQIAESYQSALLIPMKRIVSGFNISNLSLSSAQVVELVSGSSVILDINKFLQLHTNHLQSIISRLSPFAKHKIVYASNRLSVFLQTLRQKIRVPLLFGGKIGVPYIVKAGILGILYELIDSNTVVPDNIYANDTVSDGLDSGSRFPAEIVKELLSKHRNESFRLSVEEIRTEIAKRSEKEKMLIISKFDSMTPEEKAIEGTKKRLGLGDWSVGGTKAIYLYNPDQYERDRVQRANMGIVDFKEVDNANGPEIDNQGFKITRGKEDGYNNVDQVEEDY